MAAAEPAEVPKVYQMIAEIAELEKTVQEASDAVSALRADMRPLAKEALKILHESGEKAGVAEVNGKKYGFFVKEEMSVVQSDFKANLAESSVPAQYHKEIIKAYSKKRRVSRKLEVNTM